MHGEPGKYLQRKTGEMGGEGMNKILDKCRCGSKDIIIHESGGYVLIICQNCGRQFKIHGTREEAIRLWNEEEMR